MRGRTIIRCVFIAAALSGLSAYAEEKAPELKIPPVVDRPIEGQPNVADSKIAAVPAGSPDASPANEPATEATPTEKETAEAAGEAAPDSIVPEPFPLSRYATLWENSPFQIESIAPPQQSEGLAQRFVLGGILRENGEPVIWVRERATQQSFKVARNATNNLGLSLVEVDESMPRQSEASATVRLANEQGVIKFDAVSGGAVPGAGIAPPPMPRPAVPMPLRSPQQMGMPAPQSQPFPNNAANAANAQARAVAPGIAAPGVVPPVPGPAVPPPGQVQPQTPGQEQMPPPRVIRRRAIVPAAPGAP